MLTYEQKRLFLIVVVAIMLVPMILIGLSRFIKQEIHNWRCPAIREVGEFQKVFNEYAAEAGLSIDLSEAQWRESGYYHAKTVPVTGAEIPLYCTVVGRDESNSAIVVKVEFRGEYEAETDMEVESLSDALKICYQIFAPTAYFYYDRIKYRNDEYSYVTCMKKAVEDWKQDEMEFVVNFLSDDVQSGKSEHEHLRFYSRITEDGTYEKGFTWS